jgi:hypothetical protein
MADGGYMADGGKIKVGNKYGDWSITQYEPITYDDLGAMYGGVIKLVNQDTFEDVYIRNSKDLRSPYWYVSYRQRRIEDKSPKNVIERFLKVADNGKMADGGMMSDGGAVKGRNDKTGESFGIVIGSIKKSDDYIDGGTEMNVRKSYGSRIGEVKLIFDNKDNLHEVIDYGYSVEGYPSTSGGSGRKYNYDKKETIKFLSEMYSPSFAKKIIERVSVKMSNGGEVNKYAEVFDKLKKGDKIKMTFSSGIKRSNERELVVLSKTIVGKGKSYESEKITFKNLENPEGVKYYAYKRKSGYVGFAMGDMAISDVQISFADKMAKGGGVKDRSERDSIRLAKEYQKVLDSNFDDKVYQKYQILVKDTQIPKSDLQKIEHYISITPKSKRRDIDIYRYWGIDKMAKGGMMADGGETSGMEVVNYLKGVSGLRASYIAEWGDKNNVDLAQVEKAIKTKKLKPIDFSTALSGKDGNKYAKEIIAKYSQNKMEDGGVMKKGGMSDRQETQENNFGVSYKLGDKFNLGYRVSDRPNVEVSIVEIMPSGLYFKVDKSSKLFSIKTLHSKGSTYTSGEYLVPIKNSRYANGGIFEKIKQYGKKGVEKTKQGYGKAKEYTKKQIHDQKKKIALEVIDDTKDSVPNQRDKIHLRASEDFIERLYDKGGMTNKNTTFDDKVKAIQSSLLKRKKVSPKVQEDYGKTYSRKEALQSAKRIAGSMRKKGK